MNRAFRKTISLLVTLSLFFACCGTIAATASTDTIYQSDLYFWYHPGYLLNQSGLSAYRQATSSTMFNILNDYFDSDTAKWTTIKTAIGSISPVELAKLISDNWGGTEFTYQNALDAANKSFITTLLNADSASCSELGTAAKITKRGKQIISLIDTFDKEVFPTETTEDHIIIEYFAMLSENGVFVYLSETQLTIVRERVLTDLSALKTALGAGTTALKAAEAVSLALLIEDVRAELLDELISAAPSNSDLYAGMTRLKSQLRNGWSSYFGENYLKDEALKKLSSALEKGLLGSFSSPYGFVKLILELASWITFDILFDVPDLSDLSKQQILLSYSTSLYGFLIDKLQQFNTEVSVRDVIEYQTYFDAFIAATNAALSATEELTLSSNEAQLTTTQSEYKSYGYDTYISSAKKALSDISPDERVLREGGAKTISLPVCFSAPSDVIAEGYAYCFGNSYPLDLTLTGSGKLSLDGISALCVEGDLTLNCSGDLAIPVETTGNVSIGSSTVTLNSLTLNGTDTQGVSGPLKAETLTANCPSFQQSGNLTVEALCLNSVDATIKGAITATGSVYGPSARVSGGKNVFLSGGTVLGGQWNGDLTVQNAALNSVEIQGDLYDKGGSVYGGSTSILRDLTCSGGSSVQSGATLSLYGTGQFSGTVSGGGTIRAYGDVSVSNGVSMAGRLSVCGSVPQDITGEFTVDSLSFANGDHSAKVWNTVTVTALMENPSGTVTTVTPVFLAEGAVLSGRFSGSLSTATLTLPKDAAIGGNLTLRSGGTLRGTDATVDGKLILSGAGTIDGCKLTVGGLSSADALTLQNDAAITVRGDASVGGTLTNPSELVVLGDLTLNGLTATGTLRVRGDTVVSGTTTLSGLTLDGSFRQQIAGSSFTVGDLKLHNTSGRPVKLAQTITVTGRYDNPSTTVQGGSILGGLETAPGVTTDTTVRGDLKLSEPLVLTGCTLTVNGAVSVPTVTLTNARLIVNGALSLTGSAGTVDQDSGLTVRGELSANSGTLTVDGALDVRGDLLLGSAALTGGTLALGGDLYGSGQLRPSTLTLNGLIRQRISADDLHTGSVTLSNSSKGGVLLLKKLYYSGTLEEGSTAVFNGEMFIKEGN